ncbi:MAG: flagellar brake protein [Gammaproteobacteria bacterium]|nr:flagellar brake protein [Gammaproteobacteria bacterium]MBQ0839500.1 flagellar brake protein [Gammaproteobacteria bacterium]
MPREEPATVDTDRARPGRHQDGVKIKAHKFLILKALQENRCPLSLSITGIDGAFVSIILAIDAKNDCLELDELADGDAHSALLENKNYRASGWLKGVNIDFTASIIDHQQIKGLTRYRSSLPDTIYQNQRRTGYRTPVSMMSSPEVHLILGDNQIVTAQISDISTSGALLTVAAGSPLGAGDKIAQCIFKTLSNKMIIVEAEVKRQIETEHSSRTRLGCRFINVDLSTAQDIQRYAAAVERLNARRR